MPGMRRQLRRGLFYLGLVVGLLALYTLAYYWGMRTFEHDPRSLLQSLHIVVETFTTVGYGEDAPWQSPQMTALVILMQLSGVTLFFLALPLFVVPWIERHLAVDPPRSADASDHVVVCGLSSRGEVLREELVAEDVDHVVVTDDADRARELHESGLRVVYGDPERRETLRAASVPAARAVVADVGDERNATVTLSARELAPYTRIVAFVEFPGNREYLRYAGADRVLTPRHLLGQSIANKVTSAVRTELDETVPIDEDFELVELPVQQGSALDGVSLADARVRERTGANVIGAWFSGEFVSNPDPDRSLDRSTVLLVTGHERQLERLKRLTHSESRRHRRESVIVAGFGEVGSTVAEHVSDSGLTCTVVDQRDDPGVDVVGDATDLSTLRRAGIDDASALIVALDDDTTTIFSTLVAREHSEDIEIVCRASETESVGKFYSAGADYVLALESVSGRMLVSAVLDEDVISLDTQIELVRTAAPGLAGQTLAEADVRSETGCTVVAVERDGEVVVELDADFRLREGDELVLAGTDESIIAFHDRGWT